MGTYGPGGATGGGGGAGDGPKKFKRKKPLDPTGFIMLDQESRMHYRSFRDQPVLQVRGLHIMYSKGYPSSIIRLSLTLLPSVVYVWQPQSDYFKYMMPPAAELHAPINSLPLHHLRTIIVRDKRKEVCPDKCCYLPFV